MTTASEPAPSPPFTQKREFWVLMGYAVVLGVFGAFAGLRVHGRDRVRGPLVRRFQSGLVRRAVVVGGGHRGRPVSSSGCCVADAPARADTRADRRSAGGARRPAVGAGDRGRLGGVVDRRRQPGPGEGLWAPSAAAPAAGSPSDAEAQPRGRAAVHLVRLRRRVRRAVLQHGDRGDVHPGARSPRRPPVRQGPRREIVASSVSFGIYFAIAGAVFLDAYQVPQYAFEDWQLLAGIPLGLLAALVVTLLVVLVQAGDAAVRPGEGPSIVRQRWAVWCSGSSAWHCR